MTRQSNLTGKQGPIEVGGLALGTSAGGGRVGVHTQFRTAHRAGQHSPAFSLLGADGAPGPWLNPVTSQVFSLCWSQPLPPSLALESCDQFSPKEQKWEMTSDFLAKEVGRSLGLFLSLSLFPPFPGHRVSLILWDAVEGTRGRSLGPCVITEPRFLRTRIACPPLSHEQKNDLLFH